MPLTNNRADCSSRQPAGPPPEAIQDSYGRRLDYLRLSVTDLCNLRCQYCMPPSGVHKLKHEEILTLEELARIARVAVRQGVSKIRLTGGEPLLRKNLSVLLAALHSLKPRPYLRLTTNGVYLDDYWSDLAQYGFNTINISLDTLRPERYHLLTGLDAASGPPTFHKVLNNIKRGLTLPGFKIKLNMVPLAGLNDDEIMDFARLSCDYPLEVRFIEYMPVGRGNAFRQERFLSNDQIMDRLAALGPLTPLPRRAQDGPAVYYALPQAPGRLGFISAMSSHFCRSCNRLRISAQGLLVPCLFSEENINLRQLMRSGADDQRLGRALAKAALLKPERHERSLQAVGCQMSHLGG